MYLNIFISVSVVLSAQWLGKEINYDQQAYIFM